MKKIVCFILSLVMLLSLATFPVWAETSVEQNVTSLNSGRGENHLVVYTSAFAATTNTNEWGVEAVVDENNKIVRITTTGNETIPEGGFVLSGHGEMKTWMQNNCKVGMYCYFDERGMTVLVTDTPTQYGGMFFTVTHTIDGFNKTRYENQLVIYEGSGTTGTNQWGTEAAVGPDGRVDSVGGNDIAIPKGGFVISGHGSSSDWVTRTISVGMKASYDKATNTLTLEMDAEAYIRGIDIGINRLESVLKEAKETFTYCDYDYIQSCIDDMNKLRAQYPLLETEDEKADCIAEINALLYEGLTACCESRPVEYRGAWIRPSQKTQAEVSDYVQRLYDAGINTLCIETLYDSTLIFPAPEGSDFEHNPRFNGFDVLKAYVEECHKRDMELHVWMPVFYSSHTTCSNLKRSAWYKNPTWRAINNFGKDVAVEDDSDFCFINPAHPDVQQFLLDTYKYILENYDIDGFELDYIRYQDGIGDDYGYDTLTIGGFEEKYGVTPKFDTSASYWDNWVQYRCDIITGFVGKVRQMFTEIRPDVLLCADVGPDAAGARNGLYQDYATWMEKGWIDLLKPMSYTLDAVEATDKNVAKMNGKFLTSGIGVYSEAYNGYDAANHTIIANQKGADGVMFFEASTYLGKETATYLVAHGAFRNRAITPTYDRERALAAVLDYAVGRIDDIILPQISSASSTIFKSMKQQILDLKAAVGTADDDTLVSGAQAIIDNRTKDLAGEALKTDLEYFIRIVRNVARGTVSDTDIPDTGIDDGDVSDFENSYDESVEAEESKNEESKKPSSDKSEPSDTSSDTSVSDSEGETPVGIWIGIAVAGVLLVAALIVIFTKGRKK